MPQPQRAPQFRVENRGRERRPVNVKPKAWNHQDELKELVGKEINIGWFDGATGKAILLAADQFTLKVRTAEEEHPLIIFKHAVRGLFLAS